MFPDQLADFHNESVAGRGVVGQFDIDQLVFAQLEKRLRRQWGTAT